MRDLIIVFVLICGCIKGQDTLHFRSGKIQVVKVTEVGSTEIRYNNFDNLQGPKYISAKSDILFIKYSGGAIDSFPVTEIPKGVAVEPEPKNQLVYYGTKIFYNSTPINEKTFLDLINTYPNENARKDMQYKYRQMKAHKDIATASLAFGLFLGCAVVVATAPFVTGLSSGFAIPTEEGLQVAVVGILSGAAMRITGFAVSQSQRNKRKAKIREIASIYNGDYNFK